MSLLLAFEGDDFTDSLSEELEELTSILRTYCDEHNLVQTTPSLFDIDIECHGGAQRQGGMADGGPSSEGLPDGGADPMQNDKIAVVGMAGRFPGAADTEKLWELLEAGLDIHHEVPAERFDVSAYFDKNQHNSRTPYGSFIDGLGFFDLQFFGMPPLEAAQMDPMSRLTLTNAYEALEMSGYTVNAAADAGPPFRTRRVRRSASSRINYYCKLCGPSYSVDTACSSRLVAMGLACTSLWAGDCDTACAGGLSLLIYPGNFSCHECGKLLWNFNDIELHASRLVQAFITKGEDL